MGDTEDLLKGRVIQPMKLPACYSRAARSQNPGRFSSHILDEHDAPPEHLAIVADRASEEVLVHHPEVTVEGEQVRLVEGGDGSRSRHQ